MKPQFTLLPLIGLLGMASGASAHSTLEQKTATIGAWTKITLRVPHGCDGQATETVRITLPEGFYAAKPMPKAGWDLEVVTGPYATPYDNHGTEMTEGLREVSWSGGNLEDGWYDEFTVAGSFGPDLATGDVLYFPALQECADGTADWTDTSGAAGVANPAPKLTLIAGDMVQGHDHGAMAGGDHAMGNTVEAGDLTLSGGFARATLPNAPVGGGFLTIENTGAEADRLLSVEMPLAGHSEIHEMVMQGDVMQMGPLPDGLEIPAGETVSLKPGSFHLMFMDLTGPLTEGDTVTATLTFEKAGTVELPLEIRKINAGAAHSHSGHTE
ncbi:DUF1775 domain-containing protein [Pseudooceanicola algae]|uniref:YncI copper-binding domain-containing protein n=1 Tax=Pseudooceanicola algae TaxID=1537215 RepID=A0A418SIR4_9RHOB|nr:DUF1775 domain-containing protein [Pseudooceanicola algae]QPM91209.1 hypothetical protein PSAL_024590 [Pseudooceanicola algae]